MAASSPDRIRLGLSRWLFSPLQGTTLPVWRRALRENRWQVAPAFWARALATTVSAAANSAAARRERRRFEADWERTEVRAPLFILGHYRSGTTYLHNLLAADGRFAYPDNYQANFPRTFLTTERSGKRLGAAFTMRKRPHDDIALDLDVPTEDELALCADTLLSPHMDWHFPRRATTYTERYLDFRDVPAEQRRRWVRSLLTFARKLTLRHDRRLVFKSPLHTARIPLLLEAFPDARFVLVHRDPFAVYRSTLAMEQAVEPLFRYQPSDFDDRETRIVERYRRMYAAYLGDRRLVAAERLIEVGYRELTRDPMGTLARIYEALDLPPLMRGRAGIERYLASIRGYRKNVHPELAPDLRGRLAAAWGASFEEWGYPAP